MTRTLAALAAGTLLASGCATSGDLARVEENVKQLSSRAAKLEQANAELNKQVADKDAELRKMRGVVEEATKVLTRNSADVGLTVQKLQTDVGALTGKVEDMQTTLSSLSKQFTESRASLDTRLEQVVNATTTAKSPPIPETADAVFVEAMKRYDGKQWLDARRLFDAFIVRFGSDGRAAKAQYLIGESYLAEAKYANAIGSFTKVIDNFPKSEIVPDAMFRNGQAFKALKYCGDARIYFQELLRRYPKTEWKKDANDELRKLQSDAKNKSVCQS